MFIAAFFMIARNWKQPWKQDRVKSHHICIYLLRSPLCSQVEKEQRGKVIKIVWALPSVSLCARLSMRGGTWKCSSFLGLSSHVPLLVWASQGQGGTRVLKMSGFCMWPPNISWPCTSSSAQPRRRRSLSNCTHLSSHLSFKKLKMIIFCSILCI